MSKTEMIDSTGVTDSRADLVIPNGFSFGPVTRSVAVVLMICGLLILVAGGPAGYILGSILAVAALFTLTAAYGTEISLSNGYIREYASYFGVKSGKWMSTIGLPDIAVLKLGKTRGVVNFATGGIAMDVDASVNEVYLLSATHRKRVLVKVCKSAKEAIDFAQNLAAQMNKKFVVFNPVVSEQTKARR